MRELPECTFIDDGTVEMDPAEKFAPILKRLADYELSLARLVIASRETLSECLSGMLVREMLKNRLALLAYACEVPAHRKRIPMDVQKMVEAWAPLVVKLATAHDIDERDLASSQLDELLAPILAAPVAQIRTFYRSLSARLKEDPAVPWSVWRLWEFWGEHVLDKITKEEEVGLKKEIAKRIAENSIVLIPTSDWIDSMAGALQWRSPEKLEQVEASLAAGAKPRVRGKESCLFLQVAEHEVML